MYNQIRLLKQSILSLNPKMHNLPEANKTDNNMNKVNNTSNIVDLTEIQGFHNIQQ